MSFALLTPRRGSPRSRAELKKVMGKGPLYDFLQFQAGADVVFKAYDFDDGVLDTTNTWAVAESVAGNTVFAAPSTKQASGTIVGVCAAANDNASISLIGPLIYKGDKNCGLQARLKLSTSTVHVEVGFVEAVPGGNTGAINDIDTPTAYAADFAVVAKDNDQTLKTLALVTEGSTAGQDPQKTNAGTTNVVADTYFTVRIQLVGNSAFAWVDGEYVGGHTAAIEGGTLVAPWVYVQNRHTDELTCTVDYIWVWEDRT